MKNKKTTGENIRLIREQLRYSQEYVADQLGITQQSYSSIEKKSETATLKRLKEIARILQVDLITLLGEDDADIRQHSNPPNTNSLVGMHVSNADKEVYERFIAQLKAENEFLKSLIKKTAG